MKRTKARSLVAAQEVASAVDQTPGAPETTPAAPEVTTEESADSPEASEALSEAAPVVPEASEALSEAAPVVPEASAGDVQATVAALQASVEALTAQLQETRDRLEAKEHAEQRAKRLEKAGIPSSLGSFIRDDADLGALNETLAGLAKSPQAPSGVAPTSTLPTVGTKSPAGEILSIDEMIVRAEENGDKAVLSSLKLAKLSQVSHKLI